MSGSAGGNRITREAVSRTVDAYIKQVLSKFPGFRGAKISGSYNTSNKEDFGDIDLIVNLEGTDKKNIKLELAKYVSSLPDDVIVPFKSEKYKGKKHLNTGEIITVLYPIIGMPDNFVQIDNIVSISDEEAEFKKEFLDYPAEIQGLLLGLAKVICLEEDPKSIFSRMGITNIPTLEPNQEYEFNLSSSGLTLRIVTLDNFKETDRTEVWKTSNWNNIKKLFSNYNIDGSFEELLNDINSKLSNPRSRNRVRGIFNSMVSIKSGEVGTPKGDNKQRSLDKVNSMLSELNLGQYLAKIILEADDQPKRTIALLPGKFKPPHKGHLEAALKLLNIADEVIVLISHKPKDGITAQQSLNVWNLYKSKFFEDKPIEIKISPPPTPVGKAYDIAAENPNTDFIMAFGKEDINLYSDNPKYPNVKLFDAGNIEDIHASNLRPALLQGDKETIKKFIPSGITVEEYIKALNLPSEEKLNESPPLEFERDEYEDYVNQNRDKVEQAAAVFNFPIDDMVYAFTAGDEVVLSDDVWSKLENSKSYKIKSLDEAIQYALKLGINPKPYIDFIKEGKELPLPMVLCYGQNKYYLVGGEVILALYRALGSIPTVLQATINMQTKTLPEPMNEVDENSKPHALIKEFMKFAAKELGLNQLPSGITISYDTDKAKDNRSMGSFSPGDGKVWLYIKDRTPADYLRTLAHELVHRKQAEDGRLDPASGKTGSDIENEANAEAGVLLRKFGELNNTIYEK